METANDCAKQECIGDCANCASHGAALPRWQDVVFDIRSQPERREMLEEGTSLPVTLETDPLLHAKLCTDLSDGELLGSEWDAYVRIPVAYMTDDGCERAMPQVDFATLPDSVRLMMLVEEHSKSTVTNNDVSKKRGKSATKSPPKAAKKATRKR